MVEALTLGLNCASLAPALGAGASPVAGDSLVVGVAGDSLGAGDPPVAGDPSVAGDSPEPPGAGASGSMRCSTTVASTSRPHATNPHTETASANRKVFAGPCCIVLSLPSAGTGSDSMIGVP